MIFVKGISSGTRGAAESSTREGGGGKENQRDGGQEEEGVQQVDGWSRMIRKEIKGR